MMTPGSSCCQSLSTTPLSCAFAAPRFLLGVEDAKLRGAYLDPAAGKVNFGEWAERWYKTTAGLNPPRGTPTVSSWTTRSSPPFEKATLAGRATRVP